ncbi:sugar phosphate isomerase/epimerase family protein [Kitasatospora sp. NPDC048545]|uniref:sugar phosphate isomerase/epimerase family protein n=1 Tax=Kitasatospora sp. NPDC048545 TaxID=3157208 RepID=UPI0033D72098
MTGAAQTSMALPLVGLSTTVVGASTDLGRLAETGADVLELCRCDFERWTRIARFIRSSSTPIGLHCPIPYDGQLTSFEITGPDQSERRLALRLVERTLQAAAESTAAYVVVHFPSPRRAGPWSESRPAADPDGWARILQDGADLAELQRRFGVPVFVENLSYHPEFGSAAHYRALFESFPNLRMCLDVGHAHLSRHSTDLFAFVRDTAGFVGSVHWYDTVRTGPDAGRHDRPPAAVGLEEDRIDLPALLRTLAAQGRPDYMVLEYAGAVDEFAAARSAVRRLRESVGELSWR